MSKNTMDKVLSKSIDNVLLKGGITERLVEIVEPDNTGLVMKVCCKMFSWAAVYV